MNHYQIRQLADELQPPESGKQSIVLTDDDNAKVVLFAFAAGDGLKERVAPLPAIIQIVNGEAELTVGEETVAGKSVTWIQLTAKTPHSVKVQTLVVMLLTLLKKINAAADTMVLPGDGPAFSVHGTGCRRFSPSAPAAGPSERR